MKRSVRRARLPGRQCGSRAPGLTLHTPGRPSPTPLSLSIRFFIECASLSFTLLTYAPVRSGTRRLSVLSAHRPRTARFDCDASGIRLSISLARHFSSTFERALDPPSRKDHVTLEKRAETNEVDGDVGARRSPSITAAGAALSGERDNGPRANRSRGALSFGRPFFPY